MNRFRLLLPFALMALAGSAAQAQNIARPSQGGQRAAFPLAASGVATGSYTPGGYNMGARNVAFPAGGYSGYQNYQSAGRYSVRAGPVQMGFNAGMGVAYNSNINATEENTQGGLVLTPRLGMGLYLPLTKLNRLRLNIQVGYDYYVDQPDRTNQTFVIDPGTEFVFDLFVNVPNLRITFFDRPNISVNPVANPTVANSNGQGNYALFSNVAGVNIEWDLNEVQLGLGYSNVFTYSLQSNNTDSTTETNYNYLNNTSDQVFAYASMLPLPYLRVGIEASTTLSQYLQGADGGSSALNNNVGYTLGLFAQGTLSRYVDWSAGAGWQIIDFNESNNPQNTGNASNPYFYFSVNNTLNRYFNHNLGIGFESAPSAQSNFVQTFFVNYGFAWVLIRDWSLGGSVFYNDGAESPGPNSEDFNLLGASLSLGYQLAKQWTLQPYVTATTKSSTVLGDGYNQFIVGFNVNYAF